MFGRGLAMGIAELVPGVSGGTIAFITGIYMELVRSIRGIGVRLARLLLAGRFTEAWREGNLGFLVALGAGMGTSVIALARIVSWLLEHRPLETWGFFFGLIGASAIFVGRFARPWRPGRIAIGIFGVTIGGGIGFLSALALPVHPLTIFLGGALAVCAWILPGVSGSFLLLLLGLYPTVVEAISELNLVILGALAGGCVTGLLLFSRVLVWLLRSYYESTLAVLAGFMTGALVKIWPWQLAAAGATPGPAGEDKGLALRPVLPEAYAAATGLDPAVGAVAVSFLAGIGVVIALELGARRGGGSAISPGELG